MIQTTSKIALPAVLIVAVCVAVAATHWPALSAKAISFDDQEYLLDNPLVQNPSWHSAKRFLTEVLEPSTVEGYYQPLAMISLMLDYATGGRKDNLRSFHITSLALHTANTALIIILLYLLFDNIWIAAAAGLLFGVHPMTVEPIPWVGERKTLLAAFFAFWSLILYFRYAHTTKMKFYLGCFLMYLLALMSKPTSTPLPAVMLLMDFWPLNRLSVKTFLEKIPLFVLGGIFAVITYISQHRTAVTVLPTEFGPQYVPAVLFHNIIFYLYKIILPINLSSHYAFPRPFGLSSPMVIAGVIGTCILIPLLLISLRWTRAALTGWLIFFVAIFPTMGIVGFTIVIASDKYAYLPSIGLLMTFAAFLKWLCRNGRARVIIAVIVLPLAGTEAFATQCYLAYWQDTTVLFKRMLSLAPDSSLIHHYAGLVMFSQGKFDEAADNYHRSISLDPDSALLYNNLGFALFSQGKFAEAAVNYRKAISLDPNYAVAITNLGCVYTDTGHPEQAVPLHTQAVKIKPGLALAWYNLASAYGKLGKHDEAMQAYKKALEIGLDRAEAHYGLGIAYANKALYKEAIEEFEKALKIRPDYPLVHYSLALVYNGTGRKDLAMNHYEILKRSDPNLANQLYSLISK